MADIIEAINIIVNETGLTWCLVTRISFDLLIIALGGLGVRSGIRAWRASGSPLSWTSSQPNSSSGAPPGSRIEPFIGIEGESASGIRAKVPSDWTIEFDYYSPKTDPAQNIPQYKFTSPDGSTQLRVHGSQSPWHSTWVARMGTKVEPGTPGALENPFVPGEFWLYFDNAGLPTSDLNIMHLKLNITLSDMIAIFGIGY